MAESLPSVIDPQLFRKTLSHWASGVTIVTTLIDGGVHGMTASAFCSVSLNPPMVLVSVGHRTRMHGHLQKTMRYGISILSVGQDDISQHFAGKPQEGLQVPFRWHDGFPLVEGASAWLICRVVDAHTAGDHTLYIGEIEYLSYNEGAQPLLYFNGGYRRLAETTA